MMNRRLLRAFAIGLIQTTIWVSAWAQQGASDAARVNLVSIRWTPPKSNIYENYVSDAKNLLGNGLCDPRGGRFCNVTVELGDGAAVGLKPISGLGWVLPGGKRAVLMDGIEYPVTAASGPVDLDSTIAKLATGLLMRVIGPGVDEITQATPALLLLVGRPDLAEKAFFALPRPIQRDPGRGFTLAQWLGHRFETQVAQSLIDHRDKEGLFWAGQLLKVSTIVRQRSSFTTPNAFFTAGAIQRPTAFELKADPNRDLYLDMVRRVAHPKKDPIDISATRKLDRSTRISLYMDNLDTMQNEFIEGRGVFFRDNALYRAIVEEGPIVVPNLIDAIEHDNRFTRTVSNHEWIHTVRQVATDILGVIWPNGRYSTGTDPAKVPASLRTAWKNEPARTEAERNVQVLANDSFEPRTWLEACQFLTSAWDKNDSRLGVLPPWDARPSLAGDLLRDSREGEITALMTRRTTELAKRHVGPNTDLITCAIAIRMGDCLAKWAPAPSDETLIKLSRHALLAMAAGSTKQSTLVQQIFEPFAQLIFDRLLNGDQSAVSDYKQMLAILPMTTPIPPTVFRPLWSFPQIPAMKALTMSFMRAYESRLTSTDAATALASIQFFVYKTFHSPVLDLSLYRKALATGIENKTPVGQTWLEHSAGGNYLGVSLVGGQFDSLSLGNEKPRVSIGIHVPISVGDLLAQAVAGTDGAPSFCALWEPAQRKAAKKRLAEWLRDDSHDWLTVAKSSVFYFDNLRPSSPQ